MKKSITMLSVTTALSILFIATQLQGSEYNFTRQWGAMGTLHQAPTYFTTYQPQESACCKKHHHKRATDKKDATQQHNQKKIAAVEDDENFEL